MPDPTGTLLWHEDVPTSLVGARASRVRYTSQDLAGRPTESTGLVILPTAPAADRPVLTWCHGTTGIGDAAAPSRRPDPARELITYFDVESTEPIDYGIPSLQSFLDDGWVVCATDYQGLGTPGVHQYAMNRSNAYDGLHIVHAATVLDLGLGTRFAAAGWSQGAGASAALCELDPADYRDLEPAVGPGRFRPKADGAALLPGEPRVHLGGDRLRSALTLVLEPAAPRGR